MDSIFLYVEKNGEITITGLQEGTAETAIEIPETIDNMPVTEIAKQAFYGSPITAVKIGENIKEIGKQAFYMCKKLSSITWNRKCNVIPADCFDGCSNLAQCDFSGIKKIGQHAFSRSGLQKAFLPENIECILGWAFSECKELRTVEWNCKCDAIPACCFYECSNLTQFDFLNVKKIGQHAFRKSGLQKVCLPKNIESISEWAFGECKELRTAEWNCTCDVIPAYCFYECSNLTQFDFSDIKKVEKYAFGRSSLQEVCLPQSIEILEEGTFSECSELQSITWHCQCDVISAYCFIWCSNLTQFDFSSVKKIGARAFKGSGLTSVILNKGTAVDQNCFACCTDLEKIEWLSGRAIKGSIFEGCKNIKEIFISDNVKSIEASAFSSSPNAEIAFI